MKKIENRISLGIYMLVMLFILALATVRITALDVQVQQQKENNTFLQQEMKMQDAKQDSIMKLIPYTRTAHQKQISQ